MNKNISGNTPNISRNISNFTLISKEKGAGKFLKSKYSKLPRHPKSVIFAFLSAEQLLELATLDKSSYGLVLRDLKTRNRIKDDAIENIKKKSEINKLKSTGNKFIEYLTTINGCDVGLMYGMPTKEDMKNKRFVVVKGDNGGITFYVKNSSGDVIESKPTDEDSGFCLQLKNINTDEALKLLVGSNEPYRTLIRRHIPTENPLEIGSLQKIFNRFLEILLSSASYVAQVEEIDKIIKAGRESGKEFVSNFFKTFTVFINDAGKFDITMKRHSSCSDCFILRYTIIHRPLQVQYIPVLYKDEQLSIFAVTKYPHLLKYLSAAERNNPEIVKAAVKTDSNALQYAHSNLKNNEDFMDDINKLIGQKDL